jgi:hypothetical protein
MLNVGLHQPSFKYESTIQSFVYESHLSHKYSLSITYSYALTMNTALNGLNIQKNNCILCLFFL